MSIIKYFYIYSHKYLLVGCFISFLYGSIFASKPVSNFSTNPVVILKASIVIDSLESKYAYIKDIFKTENGMVINLDYVEIIPIGDFNDFSIINKNKKIRPFKFTYKTEIQDCIFEHTVNYQNILIYKKRLITQKILVLCDIKNGEIKSINIGCYN